MPADSARFPAGPLLLLSGDIRQYGIRHPAAIQFIGGHGVENKENPAIPADKPVLDGLGLGRLRQLAQNAFIFLPILRVKKGQIPVRRFR